MSAFLGPIHHWLYAKIQWHETFLESIYDLLDKHGQDTNLIKHYTAHEFGSPERGELSEVIDGGNIHGWLQTKIQSLEYRMAYVITHALNSNVASLENLKNLYKENGLLAFEEYNGSMQTPQEVYKAIYDYLLEGMPCDRVNQPISADDTSMVWAKKMCIHTEYWTAVKGDIKVFDELRTQWLMGFVGGEFELEFLPDNHFKVQRRSA